MRLRKSIALCGSVLLILLASNIGPARAAVDGLRLLRARHSLLGSHSWYQQTYGGLPVVGGYLARHVGDDGRVMRLDDGRKTIRGRVALAPAIGADRAKALARGEGIGISKSASLAILPGSQARLVWAVVTTSDRQDTRTLVDAESGLVVRVENLIKEVDGTGQVFHPNPVVTLHDQSLRDKNDAATAELAAAYTTETLSHLDASNCLSGEFANVALGGATACSASNTYIFDRADNRFEQVMSYFDVTEAQAYIQSLGFSDVNNEAQDLKPNKYSGDNSFYTPSRDTITLGTGGVDDAEDADVTWHEYGHAIQDDQVPGFGTTTQAGSIGEGFGDYWAVTMSQPVNGNYEVPCVADWDSVSYTSGAPHCLRRTDTNLKFGDRNGEVHHDGQIWSRALWDINLALGRNVANRIILESQFLFSPGTTMAAAAQNTVDTAKNLYGRPAMRAVRQAFHDRGIL